MLAAAALAAQQAPVFTRDSLYKAIRSLAASDSSYAGKCDSAKKLTDELVAGIGRISDGLKQAAGQNPGYQVTTVYFFTPYSGSATVAADLKRSLNTYSAALLSLPDSMPVSQEQVGLGTGDMYSPVESRMVSWEHLWFYDAPFSAAVSVLAKLQNDVYAAEEAVLRILLKELQCR
ncbi:MAG: hypothetical protein AB1458_10270 [Bacteroidota bacterium]